MDRHLERLFQVLKDLDLYEKALIIFSSDHGEGMGEHDYFFAHGENLYNHQTHVPLIIKYGSKITGKRTDWTSALISALKPPAGPSLASVGGRAQNQPRALPNDLILV